MKKWILIIIILVFILIRIQLNDIDIFDPSTWLAGLHPHGFGYFTFGISILLSLFLAKCIYDAFTVSKDIPWSGIVLLVIPVLFILIFIFNVSVGIVCIGLLIAAGIAWLIVQIIKNFCVSSFHKAKLSSEHSSFNRMAKKANNSKKKMTSKEYHSLAEKYEKGIGVQISLKKALEYYRKAAECGDAKEKRAFGKRYEKGDFIVRKVDMAEAQKWYDAANKWEKKNKK